MVLDTQPFTASRSTQNTHFVPLTFRLIQIQYKLLTHRHCLSGYMPSAGQPPEGEAVRRDGTTELSRHLQIISKDENRFRVETVMAFCCNFHKLTRRMFALLSLYNHNYRSTCSFRQAFRCLQALRLLPHSNSACFHLSL